MSTKTTLHTTKSPGAPRKDPAKKKKKENFSLLPKTMEMLRNRAEETGQSMSSLVDFCVACQLEKVEKGKRRDC